MSAATADRITKARTGSILFLLVNAATLLYAGTMVCYDTDGYLRDGSDATGLRFAGVVDEQADNSAGADGDVEAHIIKEGEFLFASASLTQADVGKAVYLLDNQTVVKSGHADLDYHIYVGRITGVVSATSCWVRIEPGVKDPNLVNVQVDLAGVNATTVATATPAGSLTASGGGAATGLYIKAVHAMLAFTTSTGAAAATTRRVATTHYTLASGVITTVGDDSAVRLVTSVTAILKE